MMTSVARFDKELPGLSAKPDLWRPPRRDHVRSRVEETEKRWLKMAKSAGDVECWPCELDGNPLKPLWGSDKLPPPRSEWASATVKSYLVNYSALDEFFFLANNGDVVNAVYTDKVVPFCFVTVRNGAQAMPLRGRPRPLASRTL